VTTARRDDEGRRALVIGEAKGVDPVIEQRLGCVRLAPARGVVERLLLLLSLAVHAVHGEDYEMRLKPIKSHILLSLISCCSCLFRCLGWFACGTPSPHYRNTVAKDTTFPAQEVFTLQFL
jgi:hypothetical protein